MRKAYLLILLAAAFWLTSCKPRAATVPTLVPTAPPAIPSGQLVKFGQLVNIVETRDSELGVFVLAGSEQKIGVGAQVRTGETSFARIDLEQGGQMRLAPRSLVTIRALPAAPG